MSTVVSFNNRNIIEPGVYSQIKSGTNNQPQAFSTGNVMIIDTGEGLGYGGGSGVNGQILQGGKTIYSFSELKDFRAFVRGGLLWDLAEYLFNPVNGAPGAPLVSIIRAAETTSASKTYTFTNGIFKYICKNEGSCGNGVASPTIPLIPETLAKTIIEITSVGTVGDNIELSVGVTILGNYTIASGDTELDAMNELITNINLGSHGYLATLVSGQIEITGPIGSGATLNTTVLTVTLSSGATITTTPSTPTFIGGVDATFTFDKVRIGYGSKLKQGIVNPSKFILEFYEGTFKGYDNDLEPFDGIDINSSQPILIARSIEFSKISELISWAKNSASFQARFSVDNSSIETGTGVVTLVDYNSNNLLELCSGGTTVYNPADYDAVLEQVAEFDNTFFLSLKNASNSQGVENTKLHQHIINDSEFKKFLIIGGGNDALGFDQPGGSIETAQYFDSPYIGVVHSGFFEKKPFTAAKKLKSSLYHAALVCGRMAGLLPQTSVTFKTIRAKDFVHQLNQQQRELALQAGVLHNRFVPNLGYVVNQGINTLQKNQQLINQDGTSHEFTIMRIAEQLNKELVLNMRPIFVGQNLNTASPADVKAFIEGYLTFKTATKTQDNLILRFEKVTVKQIEDYYEVSYCFVPNGPLNKIFITGFILDANLSA